MMLPRRINEVVSSRVQIETHALLSAQSGVWATGDRIAPMAPVPVHTLGYESRLVTTVLHSSDSHTKMQATCRAISSADGFQSSLVLWKLRRVQR